MSFDISRVTFDPWKDFSSVVMEQGRVQLDSDWNEWLAELTRRIRAGTLDTFGRAVYPATTPNGFLITPTAGSVTIGVGRMYVDGLLVENHGLPAPASGGWIPPNVTAPSSLPDWDPALDELVGPNALDYLQQPYFPGIATQAPFPTTGGPFIVYLDVWQRCVTFIEYPDLIEKAVGVDTTGRLQTVWQVRLLDVSASGAVTCTTPDKDISAWEDLIQPSAGRLTTGVVQSTPTGPCCLAPNTGYTGMENQLYRVEIHQPGTSPSSPVATFKWSRNNASVATAVTGISQGGTVLTVQSTGRDNVLRFNANDWVEITDDWLELNGQHGELRQVVLVTDSANTIKLSAAVPAASFPVDANNLTDPKRHTRLIKWDQSGKVYKSDGTTVWTDLDASVSTGDIPVPPPGTALILENGATVSFDLDPTTGSFHVADYWNFAARTVDGTIENLVEAPPRGIHHDYARLAVLTLPDSATDCRVEWPPKSGGESGCDCSSCVTAESHNDNRWTIQQAIDFVIGEGGGKVCLGPGIYNIDTTINILGANLPAMNLAVVGHGLSTLVPTSRFVDNTIMRVRSAIDIDIDGLAFSCGSPAPTDAGVPTSPAGLTIGQSTYVRVERCAFGLATDTVQLSPAILLSDYAVIDCTIRENLFTNVQLGVGLNAERLLLMQFKVEDNQMFCSNGGLFLSGSESVVASEIRFARNFVQSSSGFVLLGRGLDVTVEENTFAISAATASDTAPYDAAVVCNLSQTRVVNNEISLSASDLSVTTTVNNNGGLTAGTYIWVVTALANGRESLLTAPASATVASPSNATLEWSAVAGATSYNVYRSVANGTTLLLDGNALPNRTATISYNDSAADGSLKDQFPPMQNDGIVLGSPTGPSSIYGAQVVGNRITALTGTGILSPANTLLMTTLLAQNQMLNLGGDGILLSGNSLDLDIIQNSLLSVGQLSARSKSISGIELRAAINANISENRIDQLGPGTDTGARRRAIAIVFGAGVRVAGNQIADIGPTTTTSMGIYGAVLGRFDVVDNKVRRAGTPPSKPDQSVWLALEAYGQTITVQGNLFESFGGSGTFPGTVAIIALQPCTFSNNQCFLDDPDGGGFDLVVAVESQQSIIAIGNLVKGPVDNAVTHVPPPSMELIVPGKDNPPVTVIGNITSMGIVVLPSGMPSVMVPLNVRA
jgi:hypothetical protein